MSTEDSVAHEEVAVVVDATSERDVTMLENELRHRWGRLDGALHAIVFAPRSPV